jgi:peptidoglycan/LPS O-acetylase OafA/YrhL
MVREVVTTEPAGRGTMTDEKPASAFHIPSLDGIRALSFLIVFLSHVGLGGYVPGALGVTMFFFLSGYLITTLLRVEFEKSGTVNLRLFYLRRALRILPPLYIVLFAAIGLTLVGVLEGDLDVMAVASQVLHWSNYYAVYHGFEQMPLGTAVYWSIAVEEHFYLVFPFAYVLFVRYLPSPRAKAAALLGGCALILGWRCLLVLGYSVWENRTLIASDTRADSLLFGCILALYGNPSLDSTRYSARWWKYVWLPLGLGALVLSIAIRNSDFRETFRYSLQGPALIPLFVVAIRYPTWGPMRLFNWQPIRFLGTLSYSMYLSHYIIIGGMRQWGLGDPLILRPVGYGLAFVLALGIYVAVERPCGRLRKRLSSTRGRAKPAEVHDSVTATQVPALA